MLVLFSAIFVLFGAPAILLFAGRLIEARTDGRRRRVASPGLAAGDAWYYRPPAPLFPRTPRSTAPARFASEGDRWFERPLQPLFVWPDWRRFRLPWRARSLRRAGPETAGS